MEVVERIEFYGRCIDVYNTVDNPLFLAVDVARMIDYGNGKTGQMLSTIDDEDKLTTIIHRSGQRRNMWFLTENGLYEVLFQSRKPVAKQFKVAVKRVLRQIRSERQESPKQFFNYLDEIANVEAYNVLREEFGLEPITQEEYNNGTFEGAVL